VNVKNLHSLVDQMEQTVSLGTLSSPCISYPFFFVTQESISGIGRNVNRTGSICTQNFGLSSYSYMSSVLEKNENKAIVKYAKQGLHKSQAPGQCDD